MMSSGEGIPDRENSMTIGTQKGDTALRKWELQTVYMLHEANVKGRGS